MRKKKIVKWIVAISSVLFIAFVAFAVSSLVQMRVRYWILLVTLSLFAVVFVFLLTFKRERLSAYFRQPVKVYLKRVLLLAILVLTPILLFSIQYAFVTGYLPSPLLFQNFREQRFSQDEIYANIYSIEIDDGFIFAQTDDPQITLHTNPNHIGNALTIAIDGLSVSETKAQLYYSLNGEPLSEDNSLQFILVNGRNIVYLPYYSYANIRLDPTSEQGVSMRVDEITLASAITRMPISFWALLFAVSIFVTICAYLILFKRKVLIGVLDNLNSFFDVLIDKTDYYGRKNFASTIRKLSEQRNSIKLFFRDNVKLILGILAVAFAAYAYRITQFILSVDEEAALATSTDLFSLLEAWNLSRRPGNAIIAWLTGTSQPQPFWNLFLSVAALLAFCLILVYLYRKDKQRKAYAFIVVSLFITFPSHSYFFVFSFASVAMFAGYILCLISVLLLIDWTRGGRFRISSFILSVLPLAFAISIYHTMIPCFLLCAILVNIPYYSQNEGIGFKAALQVYLKYGVALITGFVVYYLFTMFLEIFFPVGTYLTDNFFYWDRYPVSQIISGLVDCVKKSLDGTMIYGGQYLGASLITAVVVAILVSIRQKRVGMAETMMFVAVICTYLLFIAIGSGMPARGAQTLPLLMAVCWCYILCSIPKLFRGESLPKKAYATVVCIFSAIILLTQVIATYRLTFVAEYRQRLDMELANRLVYRIEEVTGERIQQQTVAFIGNYYHQPNEELNVISESISGSFFHWEDPLTQFRKFYFFRYLGYSYTHPSGGQLQAALEYSADMPIWPAEGSVEKVDGVVIVKFANH